MSGQLVQSYWREIIAMIESGLRPDPHRVSSFAEHFAQRLESDGETKLAARIRRLTARAAKPSGATFALQAMTSDIEAQQPLFEEILPDLHLQLPCPVACYRIGVEAIRRTESNVRRACQYRN